MSEGWAIIVGPIVIFIIYGIVYGIVPKLKARRTHKQREKSLPFVEETVRQGVLYNVHLGDGRKYLGVELLGTSDSSSGQFAIGGWQGMLVLKQATGKRVFLRQSSVRCIEEV